MRYIKSGAGFWNVTYYPYGGDFGRAFKDRPLSVEFEGNSGRPNQWAVILLEDCGRNKKGDRVIVDTENLSVELG